MSEKIHMINLNQTVIGEADRDVIHAGGLWHYATRGWIFRDKDTVILQLRSKEKKNNPNLLDISIAGHVQSLDNQKEGFYRELNEELGISDSDIIDKRYLGIELQAYDIEDINYINREITFTYFIKIEKTLEDLVMQEEEVDGIFEIKLSDMKKLFNEEINEIELEGIITKNKKKRIKKVFKTSDFVFRPNNYYLKIAIMGELFLKGEKYLAV